MKKAIITILFSLSLAAPVCLAQKPLKQLPKKNEVFRPEAVSKPISIELANDIVKGHGQKVSTEGFVKEPWDVYSDRDENTTYSTPKNSDVFSSLSMGEKVRIARFKGDYALVYTPSPSDDDIYPELPKQVEWKGWVPVSNLLLWEKPIVSREGFPYRVLLSASVLSSTPSDNMGKLYYSPAPNAVPRANIPSSDVSGSFFYILKREGNMTLLSKDKDCGPDMENLYGWVSSISYYSWNSNLAVEPNWEISMVEDFAQIGFTCTLSEIAGSDTYIGEIPFRKEDMTYYRPEYYRIPGNVWRFPYHASVTPGSAVVCVPTDSPFLKENNQPSASGSDVDVMNIFFVMEGSRDLEDFFPAVAESVRGLDTVFPGREVHVGSVIYHDVRNEDFKTETYNLSLSRDRKLIDFIDQGADYGFQDNASLPAMLPALEEVLENGRLRPSETNVIIMVGSRGDESGMSYSDIANRLDANNILLFGIQVQNSPASRSFQMFDHQLTALLDSKLNARVEKTGSGKDVILRAVMHGEDVSTVNFSLNSSDNIYAERLYRQNEGLMDPDNFTECLNKIYGRVSEYVDNQKIARASAVEKTHVFSTLYTTTVDHSGRPFYRYVALYDQEDFDSMMEGFSKLYDLYLTTKAPNRKLYDIVMGFMDKIPESSSVKVDDRGLYECLRIYEGINVMNYESAGPLLKNVRDQKGFSPEECNTFLGNFAVKYHYLLQVKKAPYPYTTVINGRTCYWIPLEYLP